MRETVGIKPKKEGVWEGRILRELSFPTASKSKKENLKQMSPLV
jgi:hypothetical protein